MNVALEKLYKNPEFQQVILQGYFTDRAVEGVSHLATSDTRRSNRRPEIMEFLNGISQLQDYFKTIKNLGTVPDYGVDDEDEEVE